jgi:NADPH:quinone reductase-like Zn-dependent oxidoreductase
MQAILQSAYGEPANVLSLGEVDKPVPTAGQVLVRVRAASVHADVWHVVKGWPYVLRAMGSGLTKPKNPIPGTAWRAWLRPWVRA